jgi:hypothetical protein
MSWNVFFVFYEAYQMLTHYVSQPRINARKNQSPRKDMLFLPKKYILQVCLRMLFDSFLVGQWQAGVVLGCIAAKNAALDTPFAAAHRPGSRKRMRRLTLQNSQK